MAAQALSHFELCSLKDDTFEKRMMIKSNHCSKSVSNLKIADQLSKILAYNVPDNLHFTVSYYVAYPSSIEYAGRSDV